MVSVASKILHFLLMPPSTDPPIIVLTVLEVGQLAGSSGLGGSSNKHGKAFMGYASPVGPISICPIGHAELIPLFYPITVGSLRCHGRGHDDRNNTCTSPGIPMASTSSLPQVVSLGLASRFQS